MGAVRLDPEVSVQVPRKSISKALEINFKYIGWGVDPPRPGGHMGPLGLNPEVSVQIPHKLISKALEINFKYIGWGWIRHV